MMTDELLHHLIEGENTHFRELEKRRDRAVRYRESRDILAHYDKMQSASMKVLIRLKALKYRRECEEM